MGQPVTAMVTLLFCDLVESTALASELGDVQADELRREVFAVLRAEVSAHRGTEVKSLGDGIMASFTSNADAARAACGMQQQVDVLGRTHGWPLALRVGISVGEATFEDDDWFGTPVVEASRLCAAARPGQVLVADVARVLLGSRAEVVLRPVGELELKGLPAPLAACEVEWDRLAARTVQLPLPRAFAIAPRFTLSGRSEEVERVVAAWKEASTGARRTVLVGGEPGVGKTRLAAELARSVDRDGAFALLGRCDEGMGVPFQPFVEALAHVVAHAPADELPSLLGPTAGELTRLVPELAQRVAGLPPATSSDPETERYLLFEAITGWLEAQSNVAPVLLVLDDLHWAAEPTLLLLRHVLASERSLNLLVVGTYRDTEIDRTHPLGALLAHLRRMDGVERIALHGLDEEGIAELVERASGQELTDQSRALAAAVHEETGGNPFFAIEVLVSLAERGAIYQDDDGVWRSDLTIESIGIPEGVKEVVGQRLSALPDSSDPVLHAAAVVGQEFGLDVVATVVGEREDEVIDALESARVAGLLDELGGRPLRFRFSHALVQQTLLDELPTARRLRLHRAIAEAIESLRADNLDPHRAALARHWYESGTEPARALDATVTAARRALDQFADREAVRWLEHAADLLDDAGADDVLRVDVLTLTGEARRRVGDPAHREVLLEAGRLAHRIGDGSRMAAAALANGRGWQSDAAGIDGERVAALEAALEVLGDADPDTRALLLVRLAVETVYEPDPTRRTQLVEEAIATARAGGDATTIVQVLGGSHNVLLGHTTVDRRREHYEEMRRLAADHPDPTVRYSWPGLGYFWRLEARDISGATADVAVGEEGAELVRQPMILWIVGWMRASLARLAGELDRSEALLDRTLEIGTEAAIPDARVFDAVMRTVALLDRGDPETVDEARRLCTLVPAHYPGTSIIVELHGFLLRGDPRPLRSTLDAFAASPVAPWSEHGGPPDAALTHAAHFLAAEAALGEASAWTRVAYDFVAPWRGRLFGNIAWHGPVDAYLAAAAPLAGHADDLDDLLDASARYCAEMGSPMLTTYAGVLGACGLGLRDRPGDRARAARLLDEAIATGDGIGAGFARAAAGSFPPLVS